MGRKSYEGSGVLPGIDDPVREAVAQASAKKASAKSARTPRFSTPRLISGMVTMAVVLGASLFAFHLAEQFLINDSRFALVGPELTIPTLEIGGAAHVSAPRDRK